MLLWDGIVARFRAKKKQKDMALQNSSVLLRERVGELEKEKGSVRPLPVLAHSAEADLHPLCFPLPKRHCYQPPHPCYHSATILRRQLKAENQWLKGLISERAEISPKVRELLSSHSQRG